MINLVVFGQITATSKKADGKFKQEVPTKTAYVKTDEKNAKLLEDFGLQKYTSKENKEDYFIIKFPQNLVVYLPNGIGTKRPDLSQVEIIEDGMTVETNNFKTVDDVLLPMNIVQGHHNGNDFFRLQAIQLNQESDIEEIKPENPFGVMEAF